VENDAALLLQSAINKHVWVRYIAGGTTLCSGTVVSVWTDTLSSESIVTVRLADCAVVSIPFAQRGVMWDFAAG
jgi:hypothetical protein